MVRHTVVREASFTEETSPFSRTVVSSAAAAPCFPSPLAASSVTASPTAFRDGLSAEAVIPTAFSWPYQRQLHTLPPCPSSVATSPAAVSADLSLEAMIPAAISWPHPQRRVALPSLPRRTTTTCPTIPVASSKPRPLLSLPLTASSANSSPTAVRTVSAEAKTPSAVPWPPPWQRRPLPLSPCHGHVRDDFAQNRPRGLVHRRRR